MNISFVVEPFFAQNRIFGLDDPVANRDGCLVPFARLREAFANAGVGLDTQDIRPVKEADAVLFLNAPSRRSGDLASARFRGMPIHVLALESEYIHRQNGDYELLDTCDTVFTYRGDRVDGKRYFQIRYPQTLRSPRTVPWASRRFACMLSGNKWSAHSSQLYGARLDVIKWYDRFSSERLDLYGPQWNLPVPRNMVMRLARRIPVLRNLLAPRLGVWRGIAGAKADVISQYRFCFCYENFTGPTGWVTEKIFDAMFAGAVPVYWGGVGSEAVIPRDCYVDAGSYRSIAELDARLRQLSDVECDAYVEAARAFLASPMAKEFSTESFVKTIAERIVVKKGCHED